MQGGWAAYRAYLSQGLLAFHEPELENTIHAVPNPEP
jgi:hypothetical protein